MNKILLFTKNQFSQGWILSFTNYEAKIKYKKQNTSLKKQVFYKLYMIKLF